MQKLIILFVALTLILALFLVVSHSRNSVDFVESGTLENP